jgi:hypothetical protein
MTAGETPLAAALATLPPPALDEERRGTLSGVPFLALFPAARSAGLAWDACFLPAVRGRELAGEAVGVPVDCFLDSARRRSYLGHWVFVV